MSNIVVNNGMIKCSFGAIPTPLTVIPEGMSIINGQTQLIGTINCFKPYVNIKPFGLCNSPSNPCGMGKPFVPTPCPCTPIVTSPWSPGSKVTKVNGIPALLKNAKCQCALGGMLSVVMPGEQKITSK